MVNLRAARCDGVGVCGAARVNGLLSTPDLRPAFDAARFDVFGAA